MNTFDDDLLRGCFTCVPPEKEAPEQMSGSDDCTVQEETEEQHQESNTEIRITVKEEEEELVNCKGH